MHVGHRHAERRLDQLADHARGAPEARGAVVSLAGLGPGGRDEVLRFCTGLAEVHHHHHRQLGEHGDRREVLQLVTDLPVEVRVGGERGGGGHQHRIAVVRRACDALAPTMVAAPATFSTTTGWLSVSPILLATSRPMMSVAPPGANGITMRIGFEG